MWKRRLAIIALSALALLLLGVFSIRQLLSKQVAVAVTANAIHETGYVTIGGIQQWIEVRGQNRNNPLLLWVHGGPGAVVLPASYSTFLEWEKVFTVVHWHQRGAGLTYATSTDATPLSIDRMMRDGVEVAEYLTKRFAPNKLVVVGHSWGSLLAARMVQSRPELFAAFVGTGQFTNLETDGRDLFAAALAKAKVEANTEAETELRAVESLPATDLHRMDVVRERGKTEDVTDNVLLYYVGPLISPGWPVSHFLSFRSGMEMTRQTLYTEELAVDMQRDVPELKVPAFLFEGKSDWLMSAPSAQRYFEQLQAPAKKTVMFDSGHYVAFLQPAAFLAALVEHVRPLAALTTE